MHVEVVEETTKPTRTVDHGEIVDIQDDNIGIKIQITDGSHPASKVNVNTTWNAVTFDRAEQAIERFKTTELRTYH